MKRDAQHSMNRTLGTYGGPELKMMEVNQLIFYVIGKDTAVMDSAWTICSRAVKNSLKHAVQKCMLPRLWSYVKTMPKIELKYIVCSTGLVPG